MGRGQVTVFIILGIVVLLVIGVGIYLYNKTASSSFESAIPTASQAPSALSPVSNYVTDCIYRLGKQAVKLAGDHGGYVSSETLISNEFDPTISSANSVELIAGTGVKIAYWRYLTGGHNCEETGKCQFASNKPKLTASEGGNNLEMQIGKYVQSELPSCLGDFSGLSAQGLQVSTTGKPTATATITQDSVVVRVKQPLNVKIGSSTQKLQDFTSVLDVNLRQIYQTADELVNLESKENYLEKATKLLIGVFSGKDSRLLPPPAETGLGVDPGVFWIKPQVETLLTQILSSHIPLLQVYGTRNYRYIPAPTDVKDRELYEILYNRNFMIPLQKPHPDLSVTFNYLSDWKMFFNLNCKGIICQPKVLEVPIIPTGFGLQEYNFAYDVSYPVVVEISNPDAFGGEGYSFKVAMTSNLRNTQPLTADYVELSTPDQKVSSLFCDIDKRNKAVNITITDALSGKGVENAAVLYSCSNERCSIGYSANGQLNTNLSTCLGGQIEAQKPFYQTVKTPYDTDALNPAPLNIELEPYHYVNASIKKYLWRDDGDVDFDHQLSQLPFETTLITLERNSTADDRFISFAKIYGNGKTQSTTSIPLISGDYTVTISSFASPPNPWIIPVWERCISACQKKLFRNKCTTKCFNQPDKPMIFDKTKSAPTGQMSFNWTLTKEDLKNAKAIEFYSIASYLSDAVQNRTYSRNEAPLNTVQDLNRIAEMQSKADENQDKLLPRIIK